MALRSSDWALLLDAVRFAAMKHRDQRRKDAHGSPFINHPIEATHLLVLVAGVDDPRVLAAAALHDVLEDTATSGDEIERKFGPDVRRLVEEVTDPPGLSREERRKRQLAAIRTASPAARLIRLADKAANLGALPADWTAEDRAQYLRWVSRMSAALGGTNAPLEAFLAERLRREWARPFTPPSRPARPAGTSFEAAAAELADAIRRLQKQLCASEELADVAWMALRTLGIPVGPKPVRPPEPKPAPPSGRRPRFTEERWFLLAEPGVGSVEIVSKNPRASMVSIDGAPPFELSTTLAALLDILCRGTGSPCDGFAPVQSYEAIAIRLTEATGRKANDHSVTMAISRLREILLERGGKSPQLVETIPGVGARFRIRRSAG